MLHHHKLGNDILPQQITYLDEIRLAYNHNFFSIGYAALNYPDPGQVKYAYMLENLNEDWQYVLNDLEANFTSVPPGKYTFIAWQPTGAAEKRNVTIKPGKMLKVNFKVVQSVFKVKHKNKYGQAYEKDY